MVVLSHFTHEYLHFRPHLHLHFLCNNIIAQMLSVYHEIAAQNTLKAQLRKVAVNTAANTKWEQLDGFNSTYKTQNNTDVK